MTTAEQTPEVTTMTNFSLKEIAEAIQKIASKSGNAIMITPETVTTSLDKQISRTMVTIYWYDVATEKTVFPKGHYA